MTYTLTSNLKTPELCQWRFSNSFVTIMFSVGVGVLTKITFTGSGSSIIFKNTSGSACGVAGEYSNDNVCVADPSNPGSMYQDGIATVTAL